MQPSANSMSECAAVVLAVLVSLGSRLNSPADDLCEEK